MTIRTRLGLLAATLALVGAGFAAAQDGSDDATAATDGTDDGAAMEMERRADLTPADQVAGGQRLLANGQSLSTRVQTMLDEARRQGDVLRVTCLDDKLTQINAHVRTLGDRVEALQESVRLADTDRQNHEYTVITVLGQNLTQLDRGANECIGSDMYETGATRVVTTIDPSTPTENPSELRPMNPEVVPFIPPPASAR